jgi:hypothetical protein
VFGSSSVGLRCVQATNGGVRPASARHAAAQGGGLASEGLDQDVVLIWHADFTGSK